MNEVQVRRLRSACFLALVVAAMVVMLGAFTRLADAGLGCPDWPTCYGHFWVPTTDEAVAAANEAFIETPVEHDKTWPEQLHRIFASSLGLIILVLFVLSLKPLQEHSHWRRVVVLLSVLVVGTVARAVLGDVMDPYLWLLLAAYFVNLSLLTVHPEEHSIPFKLPAFLAGLVILQGLFGMWTVTLKLWPQVVTAHLLGGFVTLSLIWLLLQRLTDRWHWRADAKTVVALYKLRPLAFALLVVVFVQIALGGWLSSNYAALACPDFPRCQNAWWPEANFGSGFNVFQALGPNYLGGQLENQARIAIHLTHRLGAIVVLIVAVLMAVRLWLLGQTETRRAACVLLGVLILQIGLGVANVVMALPLSIAVAHNAVGALLLLTAVTINHRLRTVVAV